MCERLDNRMHLWVDKQSTRAAKPHCLPWKGVAERSESFKMMIAGGNHSTVEGWPNEREAEGFVCKLSV